MRPCFTDCVLICPDNLCVCVCVGARQVLVTVLDVNDYRPRFTERAYNTSVFENEPSGTSVITVRATDLDEGENGAVLYSMLGPHSSRGRERGHNPPYMISDVT